MIPRTVRSGLGVFVLTVLVAQTNGALAVDLAIPCGYFNRSGGFYSQGCGERACLRFAAAGGCTIAMNYPLAAHCVFPDARPESATYSWYAGQVPTYSRGPQVPCSGRLPTAVDGQSSNGWEEVGPGLPLGPP